MIGSLSTRERVQTRVHKPQTRVTSVYVDAALVGSGARAGRIVSYTYSSAPQSMCLQWRPPMQ